MPRDLDPITVEPSVRGPFGAAWLLDLDRFVAALGMTKVDLAVVSCWLVEAPWAHPVWHSYRICVVHLRPMPDNRPTKFYLAGATHELWVEALSPARSRQLSLITGQFYPLKPINFAAQFTEPTDDLAASRVERAVRLIVDGKLSPDTDFVESWAELFGDNMLR